jgi:hypothetical protein
MATTVVINGLNYYVPAVGETNFGQNVTDTLVALAAASSGSGFFTRVTVTSSPITVVSGRTYLVDTSSARTLNLPAPANNAYLVVKDITGQAGTNNITVARNGSEKIDGASSNKTLNINYGFWMFVSDGTDWFLLRDSDAALTASRAMATDAAGRASATSVTATELGYLSGVTSAIQTQLNAKVALTGDQTIAGVKTFSSLAAASAAIAAGANGTVSTAYIALTRSDASYKITNETNIRIYRTGSYTTNPTDAKIFEMNSAGNILGTATNDNAAAGYIGEVVSSIVSSYANVPTSTQYGDVTSINLTAGDWDVSGVVQFYANSGTWSKLIMGISTTSGNSSTGLTDGNNKVIHAFASSSSTPTEFGMSVPSYRLSLSESATVYLKLNTTYTVGTPQAVGRISARRMR